MGSETFTDIQSNDNFEDLTDETLEILKSLLDSPRSSYMDEESITTTQEICTIDNDSRKISICFKAKRCLDTWDFSNLKKYINIHSESFFFLKSFDNEVIDMYIKELKRFLVLKVINEDLWDDKIAPSIFIDKLWLAMLSMPLEYQVYVVFFLFLILLFISSCRYLSVILLILFFFFCH